jgi:tetratricopeptide (TPR) repeat protein
MKSKRTFRSRGTVKKSARFEGNPLATNTMALVRKAYSAEEGFLNVVSDTERVAEGTFEHWAPKDLLAHNTYWRRRAVEAMAYVSRRQVPPEHPETDVANRQNFDEHVHTPLPALRKEAEATLTAFSDALARFTEQDLIDPQRNLAREGAPLIGYVMGNGYFHPLTHLCEAYRKLGDSRAAQRLADKALADLKGFSSSPLVNGINDYNLACLYVAIDSTDQALDQIEKALKLNPWAKALTRDDPDLAPLRGNPRFEELVS